MDALWGFLGQLGAIALVGVLMFLLRTWIGSKIKQSVKHSFDLSLEQFKGEIERNTAQYVSMQSAANAAMVEGQRVAAERRIRAAEQLWNEYNRIQTELGAIVTLMDLFKPSEYKCLSTDPRISSYIESFDMTEFLTRSKDLQIVRPFVGEGLYALVFSYRTILGRIVVLIQEGVKGGNIPTWYEDRQILAVLRATLTTKDMEEFEGLAFGEYARWLNRLFDNQVLEELRKLIAGSHSVNEGLEYALTVLEVAQSAEAESRKRQERPSDV